MVISDEFGVVAYEVLLARLTARREENARRWREHDALVRQLDNLLAGLQPAELQELTDRAVAMYRARGAQLPMPNDYTVPDGGPDDYAGQDAKARYMPWRRDE
jgi:hypothetical protein